MWNSFIHPLFVVDPDRYTGLYMRQPGMNQVQPKPERREIPEGDIWNEARAVREREELADKVTALEAEIERLHNQLASTNKHLENARHTVDVLTEQNGALEVELQKAKRLLQEGIVTFDALRDRNEVLQSENNHLHEKVRQQGRGEVEIKTLVQDLGDFYYGDRSAECEVSDTELQKHLNDGWEILNISSNSFFVASARDDAHSRIVTLKRAKTAPAPKPERTVVHEAVPVESNNRVFAGQIVDDIQPEGDLLLNEMGKGRIVSAEFGFTEARESGLFSPTELMQIGDHEAWKPLMDVLAEIHQRPVPPLPAGTRPVVPVFGKVSQS